ncbi:MAG: DUF481 domain-containing protein [Pseudomonadota bacterium]
MGRFSAHQSSFLRRRAAPVLTCLLAGVLSLGAQAQDEEEKGFSGTAKLGFAATTGNADTSSLTVGLGTVYAAGNWRHEFTANALRATAEDQDTGETDTTAERYQAGYQANWDITDRSYIFGRVNFDRDLFSGFERQITETVGYGRTFIDNGTHLLSGEIGGGATQQKRNDGTDFNQAIARAAALYTWNFTESSSFNQRFSVESGSENTLFESITEVKATLIGNVALGLSYTLRNNSDVPEGSASTDTFTAITLQYDF